MDINTIDDLLKYLSEYQEIRLYENTKKLERSIVLDAVNKKLLYNSNSNVYKLDSLGYKVVQSRLSWAAYQVEEKEYSFDKAIQFHVKQQIDDATFKKTGRRYYQQPTTNVEERVAGEPTLIPLPSEPKLSWLKRLLSYQDKPISQQRVAFWASLIAIVTFIYVIISFLVDQIFK